MKKKQMYFCPAISEEYCYPLNSIVDEMNEQELQQVTVAKAVRETNTNYFFCKAVGECCSKDTGEPCGKSCSDYEPRNGKNGCCKHRGFCYEPMVEVLPDNFLGVHTNRNSTNWYLKIGSEEKHIIIAGCQIHYAIRCEERPTERAFDWGSHEGKIWTSEVPNRIWME